MSGIPVAVIDTAGSASSTLHYVTADALGTPRAVSDSQGNTIWSWAWLNNPFGEQAPVSSNGYTLNLRFPGQYYDAESGLAHNGHRDDCPECGRYIQSDPTGLNGGISTYCYVGNNPLIYIDVFGLDLTSDQQAAIAAAAQDCSKSNVAYVFGGASKKGADCSGSVSSIYNQAGIDIGRIGSQDFKKIPFVPATSPLQVGDVGVYPGHVVFYGFNTGANKDVWSASHTGGNAFGSANSSWYGTPTWYRHGGP